MIDDMAKSLPIIIKRRVKIKVPSNLDPSSPTLPSQKTLQTQNCHEQLVVNQREREREEYLWWLPAERVGGGAAEGQRQRGDWRAGISGEAATTVGILKFLITVIKVKYLC
jgi:hypothetical protein